MSFAERLLQIAATVVESTKLSQELYGDSGCVAILLLKSWQQTNFIRRFQGKELAQETTCKPLCGYKDWSIKANQAMSKESFSELEKMFYQNFEKIPSDVLAPFLQRSSSPEEYDILSGFYGSFYKIPTSTDFNSFLGPNTDFSSRFIRSAFGVEDPDMTEEEKRWQADLEELRQNDLPHHDDDDDDDVHGRDEAEEDFGPDLYGDDDDNDDDYDRRNGW